MKRSAVLTLSAALSVCAIAATVSVVGFIDRVVLPVQGVGSLRGVVQLAQSHAIMPKGNEARLLPSAVQDRSALLIYIPAASDGSLRSLRVTGSRGAQSLGTLNLLPPSEFPKSDQATVDSLELRYSASAWSVKLPYHWLKPGLALRIESDAGLLQTVSNVEVTAPTELVLQHIRIGMLADPPEATFLETQAALAASDYFQKIPVSRLIVGQYHPVKFDKVTLANGRTYTTQSATEGGTYSGDMREEIGKALVSVGINLANYGIHSSAGPSQLQPGYFAQIVAHHSQGRYANGVQAHGLSGGNGMATLYDTVGNEFSHELGHNFGLGHYPMGYTGSVHTDTNGWGWDAYRNRMIANLDWDDKTPRNFSGVPVKTFDQRPYGSDAMAGGQPMGSVSRYTQHTGYVANWIQKALKSYGVVDLSASSGWRMWNDGTLRMEPLVDGVRRRPQAVVRNGVVTLVGFYDPQGLLPTTIYPALWGSYGVVYPSQSIAPAAGACRLVVTGGSSVESWVFPLEGSRLDSAVMNKFHVNVPLSMAPQSASVECSSQGAWRTLSRLTLNRPANFQPRVVEVGREQAYGSVALSALPLSGVIPVQADVESLRQSLIDIYGPIQTWRSRDSSPEAGRLYDYLNPYNGDLEYFLLKRSSQYGYFPTNKSSNQDWTYLGSARDVVNFTPNPLTLRSFGETDPTAAVLRYYGRNELKYPSSSRTGTPGDVYQFGESFFLLKTPRYSGAPSSPVSNANWEYVGQVSEIQNILAANDVQTLDALVATWYRKPRLKIWGEGGSKTGTPGDIFVDNKRYYRLKTSSYWYFPGGTSDNEHWAYLGPR